MPRFDNRIAVVSGASSGIGRATCVRLATEGAVVIALDLNEPTENFLSGFPTASFLKLDVSVRADWHGVMERISGLHDRMDVLVNCAGILREGNVEQTDLSLWRKVMSVNLDGTFWGCQAALPLLSKSNSAAIVNISSVSGLKGDSEFAAYDASKGGVRLLSKEIALFCANRGLPIRCNSVHPGIVRTRMVSDYLETSVPSRPETWIQPNGLTVDPSEVASMIAWLASDEASFVTGSEYVIDGGMTT